MINRLLFSFFVSASLVSVSHGAISYDVFLRRSATAGDAFDTTLPVSAGQTIAGAELILRETVTDGTPTNIGTNGVTRAGAKLMESGSDGSFGNLAGNWDLGIPGPFEFNFPGPLDGDSDVVSVQRVSLSDPFSVAAVEVAPGQFEVLIGTVDLVAPTVGATTFFISDPDSFSDSNDIGGFGSGNNIDDSVVNFHSLTLTLATVPEPGSMAWLACLGIMAMRTRRR